MDPDIFIKLNTYALSPAFMELLYTHQMRKFLIFHVSPVFITRSNARLCACSICSVHPNGNDLENPHRVQLRPREQGSWEMVLDAIKERVSLSRGGAIRK